MLVFVHDNEFLERSYKQCRVRVRATWRRMDCRSTCRKSAKLMPSREEMLVNLGDTAAIIGGYN
jgi:hypothetical protein